MPTSGPLITVTDITDAVDANLPKLQYNHKYTLERLVGKKPWLATPTSHRKQLCAEFKALVTKGGLPVRSVGRGTDNKQLYELN